MLLLFALCLQVSTELTPNQLLEEARQTYEAISQARLEGQNLRALQGTLLAQCTRIRRESASHGIQLCLNEGNAAVLAGDWPHALLAYRLAQRLAPNNREVNERVSAISARLLIADRQPGQADMAAAALATNAYLRISFWLLAALLYGAGWLQIAHAVSDHFPSKVGTALMAILAAIGLAAGMFWADHYRSSQLEQQLAVIRVGETGLLREGNGLSYPAVTDDRLRPGTEAVVLGRRGDWVHLRTNGGLIGWAPARAVAVE